MCGVAFLYDNAQTPHELKEQMNACLSQQHHRGPDADGVCLLDQAILGHKRLSIIDLEGSIQPMSDISGRYSLSFNGEIYNYTALRNTLKTKWQFRTHGDTEVLLAGLIHYGVAFLDQLEGMWAFAFWDKQQKKLLLARDRMGKKPLYYQTRKNRFSCASELPALHKLTHTSWHEDLNSTADYLRYGFYQPGTTAYQEVKEVLPGHWLTWSPGTKIDTQAFWKLSVGGFSGSMAKAQTQLLDTFTSAIQSRMVADVEVGAFLSGGVDSSLIVAIMANRCNVVPKTFSIGFNEVSYDERKYARQIAQLYRTDHYEQVLKEWDADQLSHLVINQTGQPFADSSLLPTNKVSELASRHVKVALSGDGGDELFSGYQRYQARAILRLYTRLPKSFRKNIGQFIRSLPEPMVHHSASILKKAHLFQDTLERFDDEKTYVAPLMYTNTAFLELAPELSRLGHSHPEIPDQLEPDRVEAMMATDALIYLPQDILQKVDRASMAHSLETRSPFLDSAVIKLAFSMPYKWHRHGLSGKHMLKSTFSEFLPGNIWQRRKQGFGVPVNQWFRNGMDKKLLSLQEEISSPLNPQSIKKLVFEHQKSIRDHGHKLWNIYIYLLWKSNSLVS